MQGTYREKILIGTMWNFVGTILMLVVGIGSSIVYVRYLGDHDYGIAVYVTDLSIFVVTLCSLGLGTYQAKVLPQFKKSGSWDQYRAVLLSNVRIRLLCIGVAIAFIFALSSFGGARLLSEARYTKQFLVLYILFQMSLAVMRGPLQIEYQQKFLNLLDVSSLIAKFVLVLAIIFLDLGLTGFLVSEVLVELGQLVLLFGRFRTLVWPQLRGVRPVSGPGVLRASLPMYLVDMSSRVYGKEYDVFFLGLLLGRESFKQITVYSLSYVLVTRVFSFLGLGTASAATLLMNFSSELVEDQKKNLLAKLIEKQFKMLAFLVLPIMFGGMLLGGKILQVLYGSQFTEFGIINGLFFLGYGISSLSYVSKPVLLVIGRDRALLRLRALLSAVKTLLLLLFIPGFGMFAAALITTAVISVSSLVEGAMLRRQLGFRVPTRLLAQLLACNLLMVLVLLGAGHLFRFQATLPAVLGQVMLGVVVYLAALFLVKPLGSDDCNDLREIGILNQLKVNRLLAYFSS